MILKKDMHKKKLTVKNSQQHAADITKKVNKIRAIVLIVTITMLLLSAICYFIICAINPALAPSKNLLLENRTITEFPECSAQTLSSGEFQNGFEQAASDHILFREKFLIINASVQRTGIRATNLLFGYDAFPTYYGSSYAEVPKLNLVQAIPKEQSKTTTQVLEKAATALNNIGKKIDGKLIYYRPTRLEHCSFSPVSKLMKNTTDENYLQSAFVNKLDKKWQFTLNEYDSIKDYKKDYFLTDHHWKISGAIKGYQTIINALGKKTLTFSEPKSVGWSTWYGSNTRMGIDFNVDGEKLQDVSYEHSKLKVTVDGEEKYEAFLDRNYSSKGAKSYTPKKNYENYYAAWFHRDFGTITINNPSCTNNETLLIIGDSYTNCMERFFAESYSRVIVIDPRYFNGSLSALLDEEKPKDVVCMISDTTIQSAENNVLNALSS